MAQLAPECSLPVCSRIEKRLCPPHPPSYLRLLVFNERLGEIIFPLITCCSGFRFVESLINLPAGMLMGIRFFSISSMVLELLLASFYGLVPWHPQCYLKFLWIDSLGKEWGLGSKQNKQWVVLARSELGLPQGGKAKNSSPHVLFCSSAWTS